MTRTSSSTRARTRSTSRPASSSARPGCRRSRSSPKMKLEKLTDTSKADVAYVVAKSGTTPTVIATEQGARRACATSRPRKRAVLGRPAPRVPCAVLRAAQVGSSASSRPCDRRRTRRDQARIPRRREDLRGRRGHLDPIEWISTGSGGGVTLRFPVYEELPVDHQSLRLLSLQDQHPSAQVVRDAQAYISAESRLYPHG